MLLTLSSGTLRTGRLLAAAFSVILACAASSGLARPACAQEADALMEVYWAFRYGGVVDEVVGARYDGMRMYLALDDLFRALRIDLRQDPLAGRADGFFLDPARPYVIDFAARTATLDGHTVPFADTTFVHGELGYFVAPSLLEAVFGMAFDLNLRDLSLALRTQEVMPVEASYKRQLRRARTERADVQASEPPLLFDRRRALLAGGVLGYSLASTYHDDAHTLQLQTRAGGEFLGGDVEVGGTVALRNEAWTGQLDAIGWRYVLPPNGLATQIRAGELTSSGLRGLAHRGVSVTNAPVQVRRFFGTYPLRVQTEPHWEVEVYLNGRLLDAQRADAGGIYTFEIPITYGSTSITIREYGPSGEFEEEERRLQVPFTFVPEGDLQYQVDAGRALGTGRPVVQAQASAGLSSWLTAKVGLDVLGRGPEEGLQAAQVPYGSLSARLLRHYVLTLDAAPGTAYEASLSAFFPSLATFTLDHVRYGRQPAYALPNLRHETRLTASVPFRLLGMPAYAESTLREERRSQGASSLRLDGSITIQPGVLRVSTGYRARSLLETDRFFVPQRLDVSAQDLFLRAAYAFSRSQAVPRPLRGVSASLRSAYDQTHRRLESLDLNVARMIGRSARLQIEVGKRFGIDGRPGDTQVRLQVQMTLPSLRTNSRVQVSRQGAPMISQDVSGALSVTPASRRVRLSRTNWSGRAAATLRFFVDYDGDGRYGAGEPLIPEGTVRFRRPVDSERAADGLLDVFNLQPYERYSVEIDETDIKNPLWVPAHPTFSFVTDPNVHKVIDLPFYVSGVVSGSVLRQRDGRFSAVPGLRLLIERVDGDATWTEPVFSDGTFYKIGLPPGDYIARVDTTQLGLLQARSEPAMHRFSIAYSEDGTFVDGLDFVLRPLAQDTVPPAPPVTATALGAGERRPAPTPARPASEASDLVAAPRSPAVVLEGRSDPAPAASMRPRYRVSVHDRGLMDITQRVYGDGRLWPAIWWANRNQVADPNLIYPGQHLIMPAAPKRSALPRIYHVRLGTQGLTDVARIVYGDVTAWRRIWSANHAQVPDPQRLYVGQLLYIP